MTPLPDFDAATFTDPTEVANPYFPLPGGTITSYDAEIVDPESGEVEDERNDQFGTFETRTIAGIETVVVRDTAYEEEILVEDTLDWYAEDDAGNVWYMGEIAVNYRFDDEGDFLSQDFDGSWEAGVDGAAPGYIMKAVPAVGDTYFQEFYAGVAEDEGEVVATGLTVETDFGTFEDVVKILDTSALEPEEGSFKYFAPGVGMVFEEEILLADPDNPETVLEIENTRLVDKTGAVDPALLGFEGDGSEKTVTFLSEAASLNGAVGAYLYDTATGVIGEGRILFEDTEDIAAGAEVTLTVPAGKALGLFLIPNADDTGLELEDYEEGGLFFANLLTGSVADLYDGNPDTTYTPGLATIHDGIAPVITDADGTILPISAFHAVGNRDGFNFLNPVAGLHAMEGDASDDAPGVEVVRFEDGLASTEDFDGDFDDAFLSVSDEPLSEDAIEALLVEIDISRIVGTDQNDRLCGTLYDDQLIALEGDDTIKGGPGDDTIEASDGNDRVRGGLGDDLISGEDDDDHLSGGQGDDEIEGGEGNDSIFGGPGDDTLQGGEGDDLILGGLGEDEIHGGEGNDALHAGLTGGRMAGGQGDDVLTGAHFSPDTFVYGLTDFGDDFIWRFEDGRDVIEIATYTGVTGFGEIDVEQDGQNTVLSFAEGTITLLGTDAELIDESDFVFV